MKHYFHNQCQYTLQSSRKHCRHEETEFFLLDAPTADSCTECAIGKNTSRKYRVRLACSAALLVDSQYGCAMVCWYAKLYGECSGCRLSKPWRRTCVTRELGSRPNNPHRKPAGPVVANSWTLMSYVVSVYENQSLCCVESSNPHATLGITSVQVSNQAGSKAVVSCKTCRNKNKSARVE